MPNFWIEKTLVRRRDDRIHGEYALGKALWSPQKGKDGADIYHFMREVEPGDIVLHFIDNAEITGVSTVQSKMEEFGGVANTQWGEGPSYLVRLRDFVPLNPPLKRDMILNERYKSRLQGLINSGIKNLFYNRELNLRQGSYLTPAPRTLIEILNDAYREETGSLLFDLNREIPTLVALQALSTPLGAHIIDSRVIENSSSEPSDPSEDSAFEMKSAPMTEKALLDHIKQYIEAKGYYFDEETIYNYHICLKTRPFVILAGVSGTGKSKLSQLYAEAIGYTRKNDHYLRLPVRPSWDDDRYLLGYLNTITNEYVTESALEFLIQAQRDEHSLFFLCLDEMNLAHVEYYFSQFLSALEEEHPQDREIILLGRKAQEVLTSKKKTLDMPSSITIPANFLLAGTINVDETTQPLSDKVMDRANTIEFFTVNLEKIPSKSQTREPMRVSAHIWQSYQSSEPDTSYRALLIEISQILLKGDIGLGYRVAREIEMYLANSKDILTPEVAFDLQVKQRILPHIRGTEVIKESLDDLLGLMEKYNFVRSAKRLQKMQERLRRDGYVNFWQ